MRVSPVALLRHPPLAFWLAVAVALVGFLAAAAHVGDEDSLSGATVAEVTADDEAAVATARTAAGSLSRDARLADAPSTATSDAARDVAARLSHAADDRAARAGDDDPLAGELAAAADGFARLAEADGRGDAISALDTARAAALRATNVLAHGVAGVPTRTQPGSPVPLDPADPGRPDAPAPPDRDGDLDGPADPDAPPQPPTPRVDPDGLDGADAEPHLPDVAAPRADTDGADAPPWPPRHDTPDAHADDPDPDRIPDRVWTQPQLGAAPDAGLSDADDTGGSQR